MEISLEGPFKTKVANVSHEAETTLEKHGRCDRVQGLELQCGLLKEKNHALRNQKGSAQ